MDRRSFLRHSAVAGLLSSTNSQSLIGHTTDEMEGQTFIDPVNPNDRKSLPEGANKSVLIVGGGLAGLSAALELSERGYQVEIREKDSRLGGRLHTRTEDLDVGTFKVERGLHMWFHQYYNFKDILKRLGIWEKNFRPFDEIYFEFENYKPEYIQSRGPYPFNLLSIISNSPNLNLLNGIRTSNAIRPVAFYNHLKNNQFDDLTLSEWARESGIDRKFYEILLKPSASVTLNKPDLISAAEMIMYQHIYFIGHPKAFDRRVTVDDHETSVIYPWVEHLKSLGTKILLETEVSGIEFSHPGRIRVVDDSKSFDYVILATNVGATQKILQSSVATGSRYNDGLQIAQSKTQQMRVAPHYHVLRIWFDSPIRKSRPASHAVIETPDYHPINLIAVFDWIEKESRAWAEKTGGSIIEFHLYDTPNFKGLTASTIWNKIRPLALKALPELLNARALDFSLGSFDDFTSFEAGQARQRPETGFCAENGLSSLYLAGDWIASNKIPTALMERAVMTGREAANHILLKDKVKQATIPGASQRGPGFSVRF